jgi:carbon-monoxide dehydrogenase small subunit
MTVMNQLLRMNVNSQNVEVYVSPDDTLLSVLRDKLNLKGAKLGCGEGECGACTVIMNGKAVTSCMIPAIKAMDTNIETIEGISDGDKLHPIQQAFIDHGAVQCGFCTPGMIMASKALLDQNPCPTSHEIKEGIAGNICRCTGYIKIEKAIDEASKKLNHECGCNCHTKSEI